jgi:hypothetical protein
MQPPAFDGEDAERSSRPDPTLDLALEEQEDELIRQLLRRMQEEIPGEATVVEAMHMMRRVLLEDPQAHELLTRLLTLGSHGGRRFFECLSDMRPWPDGSAVQGMGGEPTGPAPDDQGR